jgi:hypothetical protein
MRPDAMDECASAGPLDGSKSNTVLYANPRTFIQYNADHNRPTSHPSRQIGGHMTISAFEPATTNAHFSILHPTVRILAHKRKTQMQTSEQARHARSSRWVILTQGVRRGAWASTQRTSFFQYWGFCWARTFGQLRAKRLPAAFLSRPCSGDALKGRQIR